MIGGLSKLESVKIEDAQHPWARGANLLWLCLTIVVGQIKKAGGLMPERWILVAGDTRSQGRQWAVGPLPKYGVASSRLTG